MLRVESWEKMKNGGIIVFGTADGRRVRRTFLGYNGEEIKRRLKDLGFKGMYKLKVRDLFE